MSVRTIAMDDQLYAYFRQVAFREEALFARLREETAQLPMSRMQISSEQGQFLALLVQMLGAKQVLEVGTFTGYSALWMAQALPPDGQLVACDVSEEWTSIGRRYWEEAGVADKITLRLAPAVETLDALLADGQAGQFDLAFLDADKENYDNYYERALRLLRPGGVIAVDNVLWGGKVADPQRNDVDTSAIRALNEKIHNDTRVNQCLLPLGDGLMLAHKR